VFVLHPDQAHGYVNTADLDLVNILFDLEQLGLPPVDVAALPGYHVLFDLEPRYRERDRFRSRLRLGPPQLRGVAALIDRLEMELAEQRPGSGFASLATFMLLLADLCRFYSLVEDPAVQPLLRLGNLISYLDQHYSDNLTLDDLARVACLSRRSLTRSFRNAYGDSPIDYLIRLRLDRAAVLLQDTDLTVLDIAQQVGFADSNYFARAFRRHYGASPTAYREAG
jgi:AraC-like DNA-binding protein